jgi:hypothetical protein
MLKNNLLKETGEGGRRHVKESGADPVSSPYEYPITHSISSKY